MKSYKDLLMATGISELIEEANDDVIELVITEIPITEGVVLSVANGEVAVLNFGNGERIELNFNEEVAAAFVNINAIMPVELLTTIARHSGVSI